MEYFFSIIKSHYADFKGRTRRKDFWLFTLVALGIIIAGFILAFISMSVSQVLGCIMYSIATIDMLALFIPIFAICVRRVHDTGKSGWYIFFPVYNIILYLREGEKSCNKYGSDPKEKERIV